MNGQGSPGRARRVPGSKLFVLPHLDDIRVECWKGLSWRELLGMHGYVFQSAGVGHGYFPGWRYLPGENSHQGHPLFLLKGAKRLKGSGLVFRMRSIIASMM